MDALPPSPLAPSCFPHMHTVRGVVLATAATGSVYQGRPDLLVMLFEAGTTVAGVLTQSLCPSAPVDWCKQHLSRGQARALVVNAGNANAFTGLAGEMAVETIAAAAAGLVNNEPKDVYVASTGVIGQILPTEPIVSAIPDMVELFHVDEWQAAAEAIRTTDTFAKGASLQAPVGSETITITGISKGSGMIAPDMATMLGFISTDLNIAASVLQRAVSDITERTFNAITVDSDTSTSDTVLVFATGQAGNEPIEDESDTRLPAFTEALEHVMRDLAQQVARDGEGASKFIEITVSGAVDDISARRIAQSVANSPLVKTAIAGSDANWGRIIMAVGKAGQPAVRDKMSVSIGGIQIAEEGLVRDDYVEADLQPHMDGQEVVIHIDVGTGGTGTATVWTCDLTHGYIEINADYRS